MNLYQQLVNRAERGDPIGSGAMLARLDASVEATSGRFALAAPGLGFVAGAVVTLALVGGVLWGLRPSSEPAPVVATTTTTTTVVTTTTTTVAPTTTTTVVPTATPVEVIAEWIEAFPDFGVPGDTLEICGVVHGPRRMEIVVSDSETGDTWPANTGGTVRPRDTGQWCWEGEFPAEMQNQAGERYPIEPGVYEVDVEYEGDTILHTTLEVSSPALIAAMPPSQSAQDALRDGVIPEIAELPFYRRVRTELEVPTEEGVWMLARLSRAVEEEAWETGCGLGDLLGVYPIDVVCASEYGELLLVDEGKIVKAYPMPAAVPSWIHVTDDSIYSGHIGDGGLPDSTLVRIDRKTLEAAVVVIPAPFDGGTEWLPTWYIAPGSYSDIYYDAVHINSDDPGTAVASWIADFTVDLEAIDEIIDAISAE